MILKILVILILTISVGFVYADSETESLTQSLDIGFEVIKDNTLDCSADIRICTDFMVKRIGANLESLRKNSPTSADEIHILVLDLSSSDSSKLPDMIEQLDKLISQININYDDKTVAVQLLTFADEHYEIAYTKNNELHYMISQKLVERSIQYTNNVEFESRIKQEIDVFYAELIDIITNKKNFVTFSKITTTLQREIFGINMNIDYAQLYANIHNLYNKLIVSVYDDDYIIAEEYAIEAYLDNFEYLEASIEAVNATFLHTLEIDMRNVLRKMIVDRESPESIESFIIDIQNRLDYSEPLTSNQNDSIISALPSRTSTAEIGSATGTEKSMVRTEVDFIRATLHELIIQYEQQDYENAYISARIAYLDSYEHIEIPLREIAPDFTLEVEYQFADLRNLIKERRDLQEIKDIIASLERNLDESELLVGGTGVLAPAIAFSSSFVIIFREGLESVLILGAILTYLEASRNTRFRPFVFYGVGFAIGATVVTWFIASYVIEISGANRELIEAIAALSATAVLFYVSFWILNKIEHKRWMEFIKAKMWLATTTGGANIFVMLSFFTVYREGFETVLFYQAMSAFAKYSEIYVILGLVLGLASLFVVYYAMRKLGKRLPLPALFALTMGVGAYLSIAFLGNALRELQILDIVPYTNMIGIIPRLDINIASLTGIYPTLETVVGQIVLLCIYLVGSVYVLIIRPRRERRLASMHVSRKTENQRLK